ncbi:MAG: hypothetical protein K6G90_12580 [Clostridia bacterium]|nr:hypothetical protein [Clostridia bacterium]
MNQKTTKIIALLLTVLLSAVLLSACGETGDTEQTAEKQTLDISGLAKPEEPSEEPEENAPAAANEPVAWQNYTLDWLIINDDEGITDEQRDLRDRALQNMDTNPGERLIFVTFMLREGVMLHTEIRDHFRILCLEDRDGNIYKPLSMNVTGVKYDDVNGFSTNEEQSSFSLTYSVPDAVPDTDLTPVISETEEESDMAIPAELVGTWTGSVTPANGNRIDLRAQINADGTGDYTFNQGGYEESYPFTIENDGNTFSVSVPENNTLGISIINGTYEFADDVLSLHISTEFSSGGTFRYDIDCVKE